MRSQVRFLLTCLLLMLLMLLTISPAYSQEGETLSKSATSSETEIQSQTQALSKSELKKLQKQQKKEDKAAEKENTAALVDILVGQQKFIMEADKLSNQDGVNIPIQKMTNFLIIDSLDGILQVGSDMNYTQVSRLTIEGTISNYQFKRMGRKQDSYSVSMNFVSSRATYVITIMVNSGGYANTTLRGNDDGHVYDLRGVISGTLNFHGQILPIENSRIYLTPTVY